MSPLHEVSEKDATGIVANIYQDIRARLGLPFVNLIYRHLATKPKEFEQIWSSITESLDVGSISNSMTAYMNTMNVPWMEPLPSIFLEESGMGEQQQQLARNTLEAYEKANRTNAVIITHLLSGVENQEKNSSLHSWQPQQKTDQTLSILPMQDLSLLSPRRVDMLEALTDLTIGDQQGVHAIPSLFRHFIQYPSFMTACWAALSTKESREKLELWHKDLRQRAQEDASQLKGPRVELDPETAKVLTLFGNTIIIRMLGIGRILQRLLG